MGETLFLTRRLRCRRWTGADLPAIRAIYGDPVAMRFVGDGTPLTPEGCAQWLAVTERNYAQRGYGMFALEDRTSGEVVGCCGLVHPGGQPEAEAKYALLRTHWGRGLASEVLPALLGYGARVHGLARIAATVAPDHLASQRVLAKAGARQVRVRPNGDGSRTLVYEWLAPGVPAR